ncbi:MAG: peptidoglycan-binding protein [Pseudomonas balearica]|nr:peptidoglycan-binding protein [Stutzerimonas balearica]
MSRVQRALTLEGYDPGGIDGLMGDNTRSALRRYQASRGLSQSGYLDLPTLDALGVTVETPSLGAVTTLPDARAVEAAPVAAPTEPVWIDQPNAFDLERLRPNGVSRSIEGGAIVQCQVADDGTLTGCVAISETPPGRRYGQAAIRAAALFRMRVDGEFAGFIEQTVEVPVRWLAR